jgi:hypothetical protein
MSYKLDSFWNDINELHCLLAFKKLRVANFPRGMQMELSTEIALISNMTPGNISAKISNFKSVAGVNKHSNASANTKRIYHRYSSFSIQELQEIINNYEG